MSKCLPCGRQACAGTPLTSRTNLDRHPGISRKGSVPAYGVGLHSPICSEVEVLSSLPLPETRAQVAARFAFACLVVPLGILLPPSRSQPLPSPSPLVAFTAVRSIERLPLLGGEARRRSCPRPGRRCAASCWIVVSSIAPCRRLIPLGRSFLAGFINEVLAKGNVAGNSSLRQWKAIALSRGNRTIPCPTALLISLLTGCARRGQEPCAGLASKTRERLGYHPRLVHGPRPSGLPYHRRVRDGLPGLHHAPGLTSLLAHRPVPASQSRPHGLPEQPPGRRPQAGGQETPAVPSSGRSKSPTSPAGSGRAPRATSPRPVPFRIGHLMSKAPP